MPETAPLSPLDIFQLLRVVARARMDFVHDYYVRFPCFFAGELDEIDHSLSLLESRMGFSAATRGVPRHRALVRVEASHA
jgi:hypothetical protein